MEPQRLGPGSAFPEWMEALDLATFGDSWRIVVDGELGLLLPDQAYAHWRVNPAAEEAELLRLAVHPDHRRKGLARALLAASEDRLRREGVRSLHLEVRVSNTGARELYVAAGWKGEGLRRGYYRDGEDAALYRKELA